MKLFSIVLGGMAASVLASPISTLPEAVDGELVGEGDLAVRAASNCTQYCSVSAGCVCTVRPSDCTALYTVQSGDTCNAIGKKFGNFTVSQFYKWNPDVGQTCLGLQAYVPVCINTPWYKYTPPVQAKYGAKVGPAMTPVPIMPGIISKCQKFEYVGPDKTAAQLAKENNFKVSNFPVWNGNATGPWTDYWACVGIGKQ